METMDQEKVHDPPAMWAPETTHPLSPEAPPTYDEALECEVYANNTQQRNGGPLSGRKKASSEGKKECCVCGDSTNDLYTRPRGDWRCDKVHKNLCLTCANKDNCPICAGRHLMTREGRKDGPVKQ